MSFVMGSRAIRGDERRRRIESWLVPVTIRLAADADRAAIERLAARDSRRAPGGPLLLAEREGTVEAAISVQTGEVVADPFRRTAEIVDLLRCHAGEVRVREEPERLAFTSARPADRRLRVGLAGGAA
jgi:hypothetical protein